MVCNLSGLHSNASILSYIFLPLSENITSFRVGEGKKEGARKWSLSRPPKKILDRALRETTPEDDLHFWVETENIE